MAMDFDLVLLLCKPHSLVPDVLLNPQSFLASGFGSFGLPFRVFVLVGVLQPLNPKPLNPKPLNSKP